MGYLNGGHCHTLVYTSEPNTIWRNGRQAQIWERHLFHKAGIQPPGAKSCKPLVNKSQVPGLTYQVGAAGVVKPAFQSNGTLNNTVDQQFRAIQDRWPVLAFAHDLGTVLTAKTTPVVHVVGYVRDPLAQFSNLPGVNGLRGSYYLTRYNSVPDMVYLL